VHFPASVTTLGDYAFRNCGGLKSVVLPSTITAINKHAFNGCNNVTFYTDCEAKPADWLGHWNSSYRPVFWGCTLSADKSYVVSFVKTATSLINTGAINGISAPMREGYEFGGWATASGSSNVAYTMENVATAPNGTTLYAIWSAQSAE